MKILVTSDFHGNTDLLDDITRVFRELSPDLIVFCGDVVQGKARGTLWLKGREKNTRPDFNSPELLQEAEEDHRVLQSFFLSMDTVGVPVLVVPGNMDAPEGRFFGHLFQYELTLANIRIVQENIHYFEGFFFSGFGGEITGGDAERDFVLQYPVEHVRFSLRRLSYVEGDKVLILHTPPHSKLDFEKGGHKGSPCVNELIEWLKPHFVFCGHAHRARGEEWLGRTLVVNPGPLKEGLFAILDTDGPDVRFEAI